MGTSNIATKRKGKPTHSTMITMSAIDVDDVPASRVHPIDVKTLERQQNSSEQRFEFDRGKPRSIWSAAGPGKV